jgi:hypothetical protein
MFWYIFFSHGEEPQAISDTMSSSRIPSATYASEVLGKLSGLESQNQNWPYQELAVKSHFSRSRPLFCARHGGDQQRRL